MPRANAGQILTREITALDISATHIRAMLARGSSPRYLAPDTVLEYIDTTSFTGIAMHVEAIKQAVVEALEEIKAAG